MKQKMSAFPRMEIYAFLPFLIYSGLIVDGSRDVRCAGQATPKGYKVRLPKGLTPCDLRSGVFHTTNCEFEDIDECDLNLHNCSLKVSYCVNTEGSYRCDCGSGYNKAGSVCQDVDECQNGSYNCSLPNTMCINSIGSYICQCIAGYEWYEDQCHGKYI
ncbi:uncharacterized protein [Apostichopus japonicus]|uniref:uncharacterized protein n=1 Tax=Stichopus japonicus TaxID=307972 RepID=UPI003AB17BB4